MFHQFMYMYVGLENSQWQEPCCMFTSHQKKEGPHTRGLR